MRAAPPVDVPLSAARVEKAVSAALYFLAAGASTLALGLPLRWAALAAGCAAVFGAAAWRRARGRLRWDGAAWNLCRPSGESVPLSDVRLQIDLGPWLLLRWRAEGGHRSAWASLRADDAAADWHGLRVALAAHARAAGRRDEVT